MNVTVDSLRFNTDGQLLVQKNGVWRNQICMTYAKRDNYMFCGLHCPLCHQDFDGCVILCQDRLLLPRYPEKKSEEKPEKK